MSAPRPVVPDTFLFVTRRCTQRQFLLRPDDETNNAFVYCLAEAAQRFDIDVILAQMMSNHYHALLYDAHGHNVEFREHFHKMLARSQNALRGRWENLWATEETCVIEVMSLDDLMDKLVYVATNPILDGLVEKVHHWPGPNFVKALLTSAPMKATRPTHFFRQHGPMPLEVELVLALPAKLQNKAAFLAELGRRIEALTDEHIRERMKTGRGVVGRRRVLRASWRDCALSPEPRRELRPRVGARNKWVRIATLQRNKEWQLAYRSARLQWLSGMTDVMFPYGTYWLRKFAGVSVGPPPDPLTN